MKLVCETCGSRVDTSRRRRFCSRPCRPSERSFAPEPGEVPATGDLEEVIGLLWAAAKRGSVTAAAILLKDAKAGRPTKTPSTFIDQLAEKRRS